MSILIVEDEPKLVALMRDYLSLEGYPVHCLGNGLEVVPWVRAHSPRLILLDLMLLRQAQFQRGADHHDHRPGRRSGPLARAGSRRR